MITFSEDHGDIREMVADFSRNELAPRAESIDEHGEFPSELIEQVAELGLLGVAVPDEFGGGGGDLRMALLVVEELARGSATVAQIVWQHSWAASAIARHASGDVRSVLGELATGEKLATVAHLEETSAGLLSPFSTVASGGALKGRKPWVTSGAQAALRVVAAANPEGTAGLYLCEGDAGWASTPVDSFLGLRGSGACDVTLDGAAAALLCEGADAERQFAVGRLGGVVMALGAAYAAHEYSIQYASERTAFGRTIDRFQALQLKMAEARANLESSRLLTYRSAQLHDDGEPFGREASMARFLGASAAHLAAKESVQILGGNGYSREYPVERMYRDIQTLSVCDGSNDTHRLFLAEQMVGARA